MGTQNKTGIFDLKSQFADDKGHHYGQRCSDHLIAWVFLTPTAPVDMAGGITFSYDGSPTSTFTKIGDRGARFFAAAFSDSGNTNAKGASSKLSFSNATTAPYAGSDKPFSISTWVNFNDMATGEPHYIFGKPNSGTTFEYSLLLFGDQKFYFTLRDSANSGTQVIRSATAVTPSGYNNRWNHIVVTYDGSGGAAAYLGMSLYVNGVATVTDHTTVSGYVGMVPGSSYPLFIGAGPDGLNEFDGQMAQFAVWDIALTQPEIEAIYYKTKNPGIMSGFSDLPPRVKLRELDCALGRYPTIARTGDSDFLGSFASPFDDRWTLAYSSSLNNAVMPNVQYPTMLNPDHPLFQFINSTSHFTSSLRGTRGLIPGVSDANLFINQNNIPSQSLSPFNESRVYIDNQSSFYQTGTDPSILPGFDARLADKTQIVINLDPLEDTKITWSTGTLPNASGYAAGVNSGIAYFNWSNRRWEAKGDLTSGSNIDYWNPQNQVRTGSMLAFPNGIMATTFGYPLLNQIGESSGKPSNFAGFPLANKFDATGSQLLDMSKYLTHPFLLEKVVFEWTGSVNTYPITTSHHAPQTSNFFILNQFGTPIEKTINTHDVYYYLETEGTNQWHIDESGPFTCNRHKELVMVGSIGVTNVADPTTLDHWKQRDLMIQSTNITGSFRLEKQPTTPGIYKTQPFGSQARESGPPYPNNEDDYVFYGNPDGGRDLFGTASGRSVIRPIPVAVKSGSAIDAFPSDAPGEPTIQPVTQLESTSPYVLMPTDKLVFGFANQPGPSNTDVGNATEKLLAGKWFANMAAGPSKVTFFGSLLKQSLPKETESNQPLTSNAIHEALHYDNPVVDQFDVEPTVCFSGSYLDSVFSGKFFNRSINFGTDPIGQGARGVYGSCVAGTQGTTGSLLRGFKLTDSQERYYDTLMPSVANLFDSPGPDRSRLSNRTFRRNQDPVYYFSGAFKNPISFAGRLTSDGLTVIASSASLAFPYANNPTRVINESIMLVVSATADNQTLLGVRNYEQVKSILFEIGFKRKQVTVVQSAGGSTTRWVKDEKFDGSQGFRYGIANVTPMRSSVIYRWNKYGQFRDMLEQRKDTKYFTQNSFKTGKPSTGDACVNVIFVDSQNNEIAPIQTTSQNLSKFATSSLPYFDGIQVDRTFNISNSTRIIVER